VGRGLDACHLREGSLSSWQDATSRSQLNHAVWRTRACTLAHVPVPATDRAPQSPRGSIGGRAPRSPSSAGVRVERAA